MRLRRIAFALLAAPLAAHPALADVRLPTNAADQVRWASQELDAAFAARHLSPAAIDVRVAIGNAPEPQDQGFSLSVRDHTVTIDAGGPAGAKFGLLELVEQLHAAPLGVDWPTLASALHTTKQSPWVAIRADNAFIHIHPFILNDRAMWRAYIDMLARNRFNMLDLHGAFDLETTGFTDLYPMLVTLADYPKVSDRAAQAQNLASLQALVSYAKSRGVRVALMNYSIDEDRPRGPKYPSPVTGVPADRIADYTAKATAELLRQVPDLAMLGFRIGETGQPADFFQKAYLRGFALAGRKDLRLYTRSWLTSKDQLEPIAKAAPGRFDVEIKYNGEHLGLPYQAMQEHFATYSYEHYLDTPADYGIIWQVRANGTHRFWSWANTDFIRRTVETFRLGNARGFTLEPPIAYFSRYSKNIYRSPADQAVFPYTWQKDWMWYFTWGRLGYDPSLPEATIKAAYRDHYGAGGDAIYDAMQHASEVVPLVYAYRFIGADHRDFSPETETGYTRNDSVVGSRTPIPLSLMQYAQDQTEDDRSFVPIDAFVKQKMDGVVDGRYGPFAVAKRLRDAAEGAQTAIASVPLLSGRAGDEWRILKTDLTAAADLGTYHADRIEGLTWLDHAVRTDERGEVDKAEGLLANSRAAWGALAATADPVYKPLQNPLRRQHDFSWKPALAELETLDATAEQCWADRPKGAHHNPLVLTPTDLGGTAGLGAATPTYRIASDGTSVAFETHVQTAGPIDRVVLWWKPLPSDAHWRPQEMVRSGDGYRAEVPFTNEGMMYAVEVQEAAGNARSFPTEDTTRPFWIIDPVASK